MEIATLSHHSRFALIGALAVGAAILTGVSMTDSEGSLPARTARDQAGAFLKKAVEHEGRFEHAAMARALQSALSADSEYVPAAVEAFRIYDASLMPLELRTALEAIAARHSRGVGLCISLDLAEDLGLPPPPGPPDPTGEAGRACDAIRFVSLAASARDPDRTRSIRIAQFLTDGYPESPRLAIGLLSAFRHFASWNQLLSAASTRTAPEYHPLVQAHAHVARAEALHHLQRDREALAAELEGAKVVARQSPRVAIAYFRELRSRHAALAPATDVEAALRAHIAATLESLRAW